MKPRTYSLSAVIASPANSAGPATSLIRFLVDRRVTISVCLFALAVPIELFVVRKSAHTLTPIHPTAVACQFLILLGLLIRAWAAGTLHKKRQLATTGAYAFVRNPLYLGSFLMMAGFCTLLLSPWVLAATALPIAILYALAVRDEERLLSRQFPEAWLDYSHRVPRFVPWRLSYPTVDGWSFGRWWANAEYNAWIGVAAGLLATFCVAY
jgi:protein-S-isoprenylcysteine O-methyltransferase Ste14